MQRLSPLLHIIDYGLKWRHLQPGEILVRRGEICDSTHFVLHGRLREIYFHDDHYAQDYDKTAGRTSKSQKGQEIDSKMSSFSSEGYFIRDVQDVGSCAVASGSTMIVDGRKNEKHIESETNIEFDEKSAFGGQPKASRYVNTARQNSFNLDTTPNIGSYSGGNE